MAIPMNASNMLTDERPYDCSRIHLLNRPYEDRELILSKWSVESHTIIATWVKFGLPLEDVLNLMALPMYREVNAMGMTLEGEDEDML